jgi:hypothetical protein
MAVQSRTIELPTQPDGCSVEGKATARNGLLDLLLADSVPGGLALFAHQGSSLRVA